MTEVTAPRDLLDGVDLLIFDKDGTLIEFHQMWGGWVADLASRLELETGRPLHAQVFALLGVDPASGRVHAHGLLAATPMSRIRELVEAALVDEGVPPDRASAAMETAWSAPDPVALARGVTDLRGLLARLRPRVGTFAVATSDDRDPTERTLAALGIRGEMADLACADDGHPGKPNPDPVLRLCRRLGIPPDRAAVVGDSPADLRMARAAGALRAIGVLSGIGDRATLAPLADVVLESIEGLAPA